MARRSFIELRVVTSADWPAGGAPVIAEHIAGATTLEEAIVKVQFLVDVWSDRQADGRNSAF